MGAWESAFTLERGGDEITIRARCQVDASTSPTLERLALGALGEGLREIAIDLGECPLLDSSGVRALIRVRRRAGDAGVAFRLARCSDMAWRVLQQMHLSDFLQAPQPPEQPARPAIGTRFRSVPLQIPVHIWDGLIHRAGHTHGFSADGLVIEVPGPIRVFEVLRLQIATPDTGESFRFMGRVLHFQAGPSAVAEVEFLSLDPAMRLWLQRRLAAGTKTGPRRKPRKPAPTPAGVAHAGPQGSAQG